MRMLTGFETVRPGSDHAREFSERSEFDQSLAQQAVNSLRILAIRLLI